MFYSNPPKGGLKIPPTDYLIITERISAYEITCPWSKQFKLSVRFKNQFCYLDASEKNKDPFPIGRLRYFGLDKWCLAFYTYSSERYESSIFPSGEWFGTLEEAISICEMYLI
jgi:hypothetical protein